MKNSIVVLTVIFLSLASLSSAEVYKVKQGEYLALIGNRLNVPWQEIVKANVRIKPPKYVIMVGQKLNIPRTDAVAAEVDETANSSYLKEIKSLRAQIAELEQKLNQATAEVAKEESAVAVRQEAVGVKTGSQELRKEAMTPSVAAKKMDVAKDEKSVVQPTVSVKEETVIAGSTDSFDAIMNGTYYKTANGPDGHGTSLNGRVRYRPFFLPNVGKSGYDLGIGLFGYGNIVDGEAGKNSDPYDKRVWTVGPTAKLYGSGWDANFDLGFGRVNESGKGYDETQTVFSPFIWYSNYARRLADKPLFAKTEVGLGMVMPIANQGSRDMRTGELYFIQWIYDKKINQDVRLSTGLETSLGYDKGGGYNFYRLGPALSLEYKNQSVVTLSLGYKEKLGVENDLWLINGSLNAGNVIKLVKASRISQAKPGDLVVK